MNESCAICAHLLRVESDGLPHFATPKFIVASLPGFEVPGWVCVFLRRHEEIFESLEESEWDEWGPLVLRTMAAVRKSTGCEKVYLAVQGERFAHWHILISARGAEIPVKQRGFNLVPSADRWIDEVACDAVTHAIVETLTQKRG